MALFSSNAEAFMDKFSSEFDETFMKLLSRRFGTRRVPANLVYNELIQDKEHVHMNSTMWATLTDYVKYLGKTSKAVIEETERGWFITYIDRDPEAIKRAERAALRRELDDAQAAALDDEVNRMAELAATQKRERGEEDKDGEEAHKNAHALPVGTKGLGVSLGLSAHSLRAAGVPGPSILAELEDEEEVGEWEEGRRSTLLAGRTASVAPQCKKSRWSQGGGGASSVAPLPGNASQVDPSIIGGGGVKINPPSTFCGAVAPAVSLMGLLPPVPLAAVQDSDPSSSPWLFPGIQVRIMNATLSGGAYFKVKGAVKAVEDGGFVGLVQTNSGDTLRLDQCDLETVIPSVGGAVIITRGVHRGERGVLKQLHIESFCGDVHLLEGGEGHGEPPRGVTLKGLEYTDFSKAVS